MPVVDGGKAEPDLARFLAAVQAGSDVTTITALFAAA